MNPRIPFLRLIATISIASILGFAPLSLNTRPTAAQGGSVQVTAADPASTVQGTVNLNVRVTGKGFKNGAKAKWLVSGTTDTGGVTVNSTTFVSSTEVTANITVADTATVANFDIQVLNSDGRGGKGTELFAVIAKTQQVSCGTDVTNLSISIYKYTDATNTTTYNLWPDKTNADGSPVPYVSGKVKGQQIDGRIQIDNCTYDLTINLYFSNRYFTWKFPNGSVVGNSFNSTGFNIDHVGTVPVTDGGSTFLNWCSTSTDNYGGCGVDGDGYFVRRAMGSAMDLSGSQNYGHRYNYSPLDNQFPTATGTAYVKIYHPDAITWIITADSVPPPSSVTGTDGPWSVIIDRNTGAVMSYQKTPMKIVVKRL
jgi:hypothetical protein